MALNMKTLTQAFAKASAVFEKTVQSTVQEVTGLPKPMQDYDLIDQIGSAGPGLAWKLYSAKSRDGHVPAAYSTVCVWVLDKKTLSEARQRAGLSKAAEDAFFDLIRADASRLVRLRHPGVMHVVQALDESKNTMAMVTEPLFASVANALGNVENITKVPKELKGMEMGLLEVKHGLLQVAETLNFLHNNARLIHRAISPETVLITSNGAWKLGGFSFAIPTDQSSNDTASMQAFHYAEYDVDDSILPLQPSINYTAPELVRSRDYAVGSASDIFSFGCLAYHLIARKPLFDCQNNVKMYMNSLTYLTSEAFSAIPRELVPDLQRMLSANEASRPTAVDFTESLQYFRYPSGSSFFRQDTRLRALRFLDHMLERDNMQKSEFLKALSDMWKDFDPRVLRYKVLPPLCAELRNLVMQPMILPMVLTIAESQLYKSDYWWVDVPLRCYIVMSIALLHAMLNHKAPKVMNIAASLPVDETGLYVLKLLQDKNDFEQSTMPTLVPVLNSAAGETLLLLVKHAELIIHKASQEHLISHILPMLIRACDDADPRLQEEVLKKTIPLSRKLDVQLVKQTVLPRVHGLALKTTVAAVRVNALLCFGDMVNLLEKSAVLEILQTIQRCTAVDHSAPTLMCTLGVANSILKQYGIEFVAEHVLPLLVPLLITQQLNVQQFAKFMLFVKDVLRKIEEKRGVTLAETEIPEVRALSAAGGYASGQVNRIVSTAPPATKSNSTWDEDWLPSRVASPAMQSTTTRSTAQTPLPSRPAQSNSGYSVSSTTSIASTRQSPSSCPAVDVEWPLQSPSGVATQFSDLENSNGKNRTSGSSSDDADPFANWPPRPNAVSVSSSSLGNGPSSSSINKVALSSTAATSNGSSYQSASWAFAKQTPGQSLNPSQGIGSSTNATGRSGGLSSENSLGYLKPNPSISPLSSSSDKATDLGSIFATNRNEHAPLRLAPPPTAAVGKVRGRGRGSQETTGSPSASFSSRTKSRTDQPPLMDLL